MAVGVAEEGGERMSGRVTMAMGGVDDIRWCVALLPLDVGVVICSLAVKDRMVGVMGVWGMAGEDCCCPGCC